MPLNVLVYRLGSLGDTIMVLPGFHLVRRAFPDARLTLLSNSPINAKAPSIRSILEGSGLIDAWLDYPANMRDLGAIGRLHREIRRQKFDALVYLAKPKGGRASLLRDALFFGSAGVVRQIGLPWNPGDRLCRPKADGSGDYEWDGDRTLRCLKSLGTIDLDDDATWDLRLSAAEVEAAAALLAPVGDAPVIALSVGTKAPANDWEEGNWTELVEMSARRFRRHAFVFLGAPDERERSQRLLDRAQGRGLNLCGETSPRVAAALLRRAQVFVGHDSGPMHLAACVGTPVVAIFSARNVPGQWFPRGGRARNAIHYSKTPCFGCGLVHCLEQKKQCILAILPEQVLGSMESFLHRARV